MGGKPSLLSATPHQETSNYFDVTYEAGEIIFVKTLPPCWWRMCESVVSSVTVGDLRQMGSENAVLKKMTSSLKH